MKSSPLFKRLHLLNWIVVVVCALILLWQVLSGRFDLFAAVFLCLAETVVLAMMAAAKLCFASEPNRMVLVNDEPVEVGLLTRSFAIFTFFMVHAGIIVAGSILMLFELASAQVASAGLGALVIHGLTEVATGSLSIPFWGFVVSQILVFLLVFCFREGRDVTSSTGSYAGTFVDYWVHWAALIGLIFVIARSLQGGAVGVSRIAVLFILICLLGDLFALTIAALNRHMSNRAKHASATAH